MSPESAAAATAPMRGREAWRRTHEVRERFLAAGDPDRLPPEDCGELGISRATIYRKLKRFGIRPPALRAGTAVGEAEGLKGAPEASGKHR